MGCGPTERQFFQIQNGGSQAVIPVAAGVRVLGINEAVSTREIPFRAGEILTIQAMLGFEFIEELASRADPSPGDVFESLTDTLVNISLCGDVE